MDKSEPVYLGNKRIFQNQNRHHSHAIQPSHDSPQISLDSPESFSAVAD